MHLQNSEPACSPPIHRLSLSILPNSDHHNSLPLLPQPPPPPLSLPQLHPHAAVQDSCRLHPESSREATAMQTEVLLHVCTLIGREVVSSLREREGVGASIETQAFKSQLK